MTRLTGDVQTRLLHGLLALQAEVATARRRVREGARTTVDDEIERVEQYLGALHGLQTVQAALTALEGRRGAR